MTRSKKPESPFQSEKKSRESWARRNDAMNQIGGRRVHKDATGQITVALPDTGISAGPSTRSVTRLFRDAKTGEFLARASMGVIKSLKDAGYSSSEIAKLVVSKRSLERRQQKNEPLSASETDRALRVERIQEHAIRVFGSEEKAHRWLRKPCRALEGAIPLELMVSETGAHIVDMELHAIDHGMYA